MKHRTFGQSSAVFAVALILVLAVSAASGVALDSVAKDDLVNSVGAGDSVTKDDMVNPVVADDSLVKDELVDSLVKDELVVADVADAAKGPKIVFAKDAHDFGKIKQGDEPAYEFVFKNEGDALLTIKNVETTCGCTAALVSEKKVEPGKTGKIKVAFSSRGYSGEVTKYIFVESDDLLAPRLQLKISAAVDVPPQPRIDLDKYTFDAGLLVEGDTLKAQVTVKNRGELELRFECELANAAFSVGGKPAKFPIKVAAGQDVDVEISLALANRIGMVREFVLFKTNDPLRSTISMNLNGYLVTRDQLKKLFDKYKNVIK